MEPYSSKDAQSGEKSQSNDSESHETVDNNELPRESASENIEGGVVFQVPDSKGDSDSNTDSNEISSSVRTFDSLKCNDLENQVDSDKNDDFMNGKNDDSGKSGESDKNESADEGASDATSNSSSGSHKTKKSNRCQVCRKKVGLTGFVCRCGGLFCSLHRYSDKHTCTFNYRELGAEEIRKNNPVVLGEKIHKI